MRRTPRSRRFGPVGDVGEAAGERNGQQKGEQDGDAGKKEAQFIQELVELPVVVLLLTGLVPAARRTASGLMHFPWDDSLRRASDACPGIRHCVPPDCAIRER